MIDHKTYDIYYDEEGDFLEVAFGMPSKKEYAEEVEPGVFVVRDEDTNEVKSVGILSFKRRAELLKSVLERIHMSLPLEIRSAN
ncbi:MAG: hypothetical protein AABX59_03715 [Nanoarchaeota archaeon]